MYEAGDNLGWKPFFAVVGWSAVGVLAAGFVGTTTVMVYRALTEQKKK